LKKHQIIAGKYRVVAGIGKGGMGTVYKAIHEPTQRTVALKVLRGEVCADNPELVARFEREARATGRVQSHHIVQVFDTGHDEETGLAYLAMELLEGDVLSALVRELGPLDPKLAIRVAAQACLGLGKAHAAGVVHRDIKPANIFLSRTDVGERVVKLLDFGIAKVKMDEFNTADPAGLTRTGSVLGSPHYMAPEQARGGKQVDSRADIWSMGVVLHKMLTGKTPHHEVSGLGDVIIAICTQAPPSVRELAPWVSPAVERVIDGALKINREERFQTCDQMLEALRAAGADNLTISADLVRGVPAEILAQAPVTLGEADEPSSNVGGVGSNTPISLSTASFVRSSAPDGLPSNGHAVTVEPVPAPKRSRGLLIAAATLVIGGGASAAYFATTRAKPAENVAPVAAATSAAATAATSVAPVVKAPAPRTVSLAVTPADAKVEVDGKPVELTDGKVSLTGKLGSVYEVRVADGKTEKVEKVAITEAGPVPGEIELPAPKKGARQGVARLPVAAPVKATAPHATAEAKAPAPKPTGLKASESFE
jgi:serine/threonine protein kinase